MRSPKKRKRKLALQMIRTDLSIKWRIPIRLLRVKVNERRIKDIAARKPASLWTMSRRK
jgi:hypothetical protein